VWHGGTCTQHTVKAAMCTAASNWLPRLDALERRVDKLEETHLAPTKRLSARKILILTNEGKIITSLFLRQCLLDLGVSESDIALANVDRLPPAANEYAVVILPTTTSQRDALQEVGPDETKRWTSAAGVVNKTYGRLILVVRASIHTPCSPNSGTVPELRTKYSATMPTLANAFVVRIHVDRCFAPLTDEKNHQNSASLQKMKDVIDTTLLHIAANARLAACRLGEAQTAGVHVA